VAQSYKKFAAGWKGPRRKLIIGCGDVAADYAGEYAALLQRGLLVVFGASRFRDHAEFTKPFQQIRETLTVFLAH
jgi:hypothetical protein